MSKIPCNICGKFFTEKTLKKNDGKCGRCSKKINIHVLCTRCNKEQCDPGSHFCSKCQDKKPGNSTEISPGNLLEKSPEEKEQKSSEGVIAPYKKATIPKKLREKVWITYTGDKFYGKCFVCLMKLSPLEFACGHVHSEATGGTLVLENLRIVCGSCNSKMGTQNMMEFKKERYSSVSDKAKCCVVC